jgi:hypothetical protein
VIGVIAYTVASLAILFGGDPPVAWLNYRESFGAKETWKRLKGFGKR